MPAGNGAESFGADLGLTASPSKIPKPSPPSPKKALRARTPPPGSLGDTPSRIPRYSHARRSGDASSANGSALGAGRSLTPPPSWRSGDVSASNASGRVPQRSVTPPPSNDQDADMVRLKMRCAERLQQKLQDPHTRAKSFAQTLSEQEGTAQCSSAPTSQSTVKGVGWPGETSEIPVLKQRVAPGRTMASPPALSKTALAPSNTTQGSTTPRRCSPESGGPQGSTTPQRVKSAGASSARNSGTPRSAQPAAKIVNCRSSVDATARSTTPRTTPRKATAAPTTAVPRGGGVRGTPPPNRFSPPLRRASSAAALGKPSVKASAGRVVPTTSYTRRNSEGSGRAACRPSASLPAASTEAGVDSEQGAEMFNVASPSEVVFAPLPKQALVAQAGSVLALSARRPLSSNRGSSARTPPARAMTKGGTTVKPVLDQILQENRELRDAFNQATQRIAALEERQHSFFDEGVFDLMNAAHVVPVLATSTMTNSECVQVSMSDADDQPGMTTELPDARPQSWLSDDEC